ncbi:MAG: site-2 protease family protein [Acidobacteria bacterium]|nr:site-2 protease family protein [Acidobacteriota bacterium]
MESIRAVPPFVDAPVMRARRRRGARPTAREWARHAGLFALTALTTTLAGMMLVVEPPEVRGRALASALDYLLYLPELYLKLTAAYLHLAFTQPMLLAQGVAFAGSLLAILTAHESGHYVACRLYGVDATLPFFIPSPPMIGPGTFGAFIKIKSPIPSRRALFDIGVAGPLAGFVIVIPVALIGLLTAHPAPPLPDGGGMTFNDPLLMRLLAKMLGVNASQMAAGPFYLAAWIGLLVTSLNLLPVGQLDGGHAVYAVFGQRAHRWLGRAAFAAMATLAVLGFVWHHSPGGFLYAVLLAVMLRVRHPQPEDRAPLGGARLGVALITLLVFALSFWPFPITFS